MPTSFPTAWKPMPAAMWSGHSAICPFGETWYETGTTDTWKFTNYENDAESGLNYAVARFQSPRLGRFLSIDSHGGGLENPQSLNRYAYVNNDPINFIDPTGKDEEDDTEDDGCDPAFCDDVLDIMGGGGGGDGDDGGGGDDPAVIDIDFSSDDSGDPLSNLLDSFAYYPEGNSVLDSFVSTMVSMIQAPDLDFEETDPSELTPEGSSGMVPEETPWFDMVPGEMPSDFPAYFVRTFDFMNPGPLSQTGDDANFQGKFYAQIVTTRDMEFSRNYTAGFNSPNGAWLRLATDAELDSVRPCDGAAELVPTPNLSAIVDSALPRGNQATSVSIVTVPAGSTIFVGIAAPQPYTPFDLDPLNDKTFGQFALGGGIQIFWPH